MWFLMYGIAASGLRPPRNDVLSNVIASDTAANVIASELCERGNLLHGTSTAAISFFRPGLLRAQVPSQ